MIRPPGPTLLRDHPSRALRPRSARGAAALNLTALVDVLTVLVVFGLSSFGEVAEPS
jgi:hypothetical protein